MSAPVTLLGIETSCDETAAAVLRLDGDRVEILAETVRAQIEAHTPYGGVVPEIAARAHAEITDLVVARTVADSGLDLDDLDAIAATSGPGLIGGVMVGMMTGKAIALARGKPFLPVNHLEGHALSPLLAEPCPFPYLLLLVSGGHCQFIAVNGLGDYSRLGTTIDDAAGEAFDKTAKVLGLGFPGGPALEQAAGPGDAGAVDLPRPLLDRPGLDMSFAGLKTAARRASETGQLTGRRRADIAASFQQAVTDVLTEKAQRAMLVFAQGDGRDRLVVAGGVAANQTIRASLEAAASDAGFVFCAPPMKYCTDNAAMIALAGAMHFRAGARGDMGVAARSRWPLDEARALSKPAYGHGKRGVKV